MFKKHRIFLVKSGALPYRISDFNLFLKSLPYTYDRQNLSNSPAIQISQARAISFCSSDIAADL